MQPTVRCAAEPPAGSTPRSPVQDTGARRRRTRLWLAITAAAAGGALTAAVIPAIAAPTSTPVTYYACVTNATGTMRVVAHSTKCKATEHKISWNNVGPRGPRGTTGPRGPKGAQGPPGVVDGLADKAQYVRLSDCAPPNCTPVATLRAPAGDFFVTAQVLALLSPATTSDAVTCDLTDGPGDLMNQSSIALTPAANIESMTLVGTTSHGGTIQVSCYDVNGEAEVNVNAWAIPVTSFTQGTARVPAHRPRSAAPRSG